MIPCCYHPTTVMLVDDDYKYLHSLYLRLKNTVATYKLLNNPVKALHFLNEEYQSNPFINRYLQEDILHDHRILDVNVRAIHHEIYNPKRFAEVGGVVVDYVMPGMDGLTLCHKIADKSFRRILLTGEDQEKNAIQGFNNGDIHQYIRKDDINFNQTINLVIERAQWQYFLDQSSIIINSIAKNSQLNILSNLKFIQLFNDIRQKTSNIEFYLLDKQGSFLLLDKEAKPSWLIIKSDREIEKLYQYAKDEEAPAQVVDALKERKMIPYFHDDKDMQTPPSQWGRYLFPANLLQTEQNYYYAFIENTDLLKLSNESILSYGTYLETFNPVTDL